MVTGMPDGGNMHKRQIYEEQIIREIRNLSDDVLPTVIRLLAVIRGQSSSIGVETYHTDEDCSYEKIRRILADSGKNWAQDVISDRADRI
jgi:hypothetical protein